MLNEISAGRLSPERLAWVLSEGTARLFGLYPRKGAVIPGSDADLTVVDPDAVQEIDNAKLHSKQPFSPWHGVRVRGAPKASILRGNVLMQDGEPIGQPMGRLVRATHPRVHP
jgi:allantoinase